MRILASVFCAATLLAGTGLLAVPAQAASTRVIVRGATPLLPPPAFGYDYGDYSNDPAYLYGSPLDRYYDPAGKIPDTRYYGPPAVDLVLARTLDRTGESMLGHMLRCQASYSTYNPATNAYRGHDGLPQVCYR